MVGKTGEISDHVKQTEFTVECFPKVYHPIGRACAETLLFISPRLLTLEVEKATWAIRNPQFAINGKTAARCNEIAPGHCRPQRRKMFVFPVSFCVLCS